MKSFKQVMTENFTGSLGSDFVSELIVKNKLKEYDAMIARDTVDKIDKLFKKDIKKVYARKDKPQYTKIEYLLKDGTTIDLWVTDQDLIVIPKGDSKKKKFLNHTEVDKIKEILSDGGVNAEIKDQAQLAQKEIDVIMGVLRKGLNKPKPEYRQALLNLIGQITDKDIEKQLKKLVK